ncbi:MAG: hypothetical protein ACRDNL_13470 [Spirillospora sp.]
MADEPREREPVSWRIRRWAAPVALAVSVAASIGAVQLLAGGDGAVPSRAPLGAGRTPRFILTVGRVTPDPQGDGPVPWVQVGAVSGTGRYQQVDSVREPSSAGEAREIVDAPGGTFVVASTRDRPCESRLHRFGLTRDGRIKGLARLTGDVIASRVGGLAMSPDGDKIAYTTAPCAGDPKAAPPPSANVTVLDLGSGHRRTWSTPAPTLVGQIVWADDGRTLGYVVSDIRPDATPGSSRGQGSDTRNRDIGNATVYALDTEEEGTDLRAGRVLFRQPDDEAFVTTAVMGPDGRTGHGVMRKGDPASTIIFTFAEGEPVHVTRTIEPERKPGVDQAIALDLSDDPPRHACLSGADPLGRELAGELAVPGGDLYRCGAVIAY